MKLTCILLLLVVAAQGTTSASDEVQNEEQFLVVDTDTDTADWRINTVLVHDRKRKKPAKRPGNKKKKGKVKKPSKPKPPVVSVEREPTPGHECNRDCTNNIDFKTCVWTFVAENLYSDQDGRRADGRNRSIITYNGRLPGPSIVVCELDTVIIRLKNNIIGTFEQLQGRSNGTTLHMHGIRRWGQSYEDGVPGIHQCEVLPDHEFNYTMIANDDHENAPPGTYWYHSHVGSQRTNGLYGKLIIRPRRKSSLYDVDNAANTLVLQEWYLTETQNVPISILINGNGRVGATMNSAPKNTTIDELVYKCNSGQQVYLDQVPNPNFPNFTTNYSEFNVTYGLRYRFRIIGAISQNFPLRISVEDHNFTAIATDSIDFKPVKGLNAIWLTGGERYDIILETKTKKNVKKTPYKIKVFGKMCKTSVLCTVAWLKYPGQVVNYFYVTDPNCTDFHLEGYQKILNPVMDLNFKNTSRYVTLNELRAIKQPKAIDFLNFSSFHTHYVELKELTFNGFSMTYPDVPFLYQSPSNKTNRCGLKCNIKFNGSPLKEPPFDVNCEDLEKPPFCTNGKVCQCEHVIHQPHIPGYVGASYWFETILINPYSSNMLVAHPIHQHGGWYRVLAVKQFDYNITKINRTYIYELDNNCPATPNNVANHSCLPRNFDHPIQKDTIQVPVNGYVIFRTPVDNAGTWIVHCHINYHVEAGMAMVFQIGGLDEKVDGVEIPFQKWSLGPFEDKINVSCPRKLDTYQNPDLIDWFYGMKTYCGMCSSRP